MGEHYEQLASLYLRLNGFVSSNLIIHSDKKGSNKSELDHVAFRMPLHRQPDRNQPTSSYLELPDDRIQIIIGDSKSTKHPSDVLFNKGLSDDDESIEKLLEWIGIFDIIDEDLVHAIREKLSQRIGDDIDGYNRYNHETEFGRFQLTFLFFCPYLEAPESGQLKYIHGQEMLDYCWACLNKANKPSTCARTYSLTNWNDLTRYVEYFKNIKAPGSMSEFISELSK